MEALKDLANVAQVLQGGSRRATLAKTARFLQMARRTAELFPHGKFEEAKAGVPPDFGELGSWLAHPERAPGERDVEDANHLAPTGDAPPPAEARPCDCFFVVDSCFTPEVAQAFIGEDACRRWNVPLGCQEDDESLHRLNAKVLEQMLLRTAAGASCLNRTCRIYAPAYRQAAVLAFYHLPAVARLTKEGLPAARSNRTMSPVEASQAFDLAYNDVRRAFVRFVDDPRNAGRPFVMLGHSQGTAHLTRLLQEEVETHPARLQRFVHAYLTGTAVPMDLFSRTLHRIRPSMSAFDTCSVSSWRTAAPSHPDLHILRGYAYYAGEGWRPLHSAEVLANNPITWSSERGGAASEPGAHRGAWWPLPRNLDPRDHEGLLPSGVGLRFGHLSSQSQDVLGAQVPALVEVDCGPLCAKVGRQGLLRVPAFRPDCLFSLAERDWLLYHDLDCALFHNNLQENVAKRVQAWRPSSRL